MISNLSNLHLTIGNDPVRNMQALGACGYIGRGLVQGMTEDGKFVQVYFLTGRSVPSKNRVLRLKENGVVSTDYADPDRGGGDPSLIIYNAAADELIVDELYADEEISPDIYAELLHIVSNGSQTNRILENAWSDGFLETHADETYEPDPSGTSRITGGTKLDGEGGAGIWFAVARKSQFNDSTEHLTTYFRQHIAGVGHCIVTYADDSDTPTGLIPAYRGSAFPVPLVQSPNEIADAFWNVLHPDLRVALMVKVINPEGPSEFVLRNTHTVR